MADEIICNKYWSNQIPAPETKERLQEGDKRFNSLDICLNDMRNEIDKIKISIDNFHFTNKAEHNQIMVALKDIKDNSASKLTEKIVYGAVMMILIAVFSAVIYLVINR
jgi:hypothetical protein